MSKQTMFTANDGKTYLTTIPFRFQKLAYFGFMSAIPRGSRGDTIKHIMHLYDAYYHDWAASNDHLYEYITFLNKRFPLLDARLLSVDEINEMEDSAWACVICPNDWAL